MLGRTVVQVPLGQHLTVADVEHPPVRALTVAGLLVDHRRAPVPDRGGAAVSAVCELSRTSKGSPRGSRVSASTRRIGGSVSPSSRLPAAGCDPHRRTPVTRCRRRRRHVSGFPEGLARGGVEDGHGAGRRAAIQRRRRTMYPTYWPPSGCQASTAVEPVGSIPHRKAGRRRGVSGDGVDEPDPSPVLVVEPGVGHLLPVRGDVGVREHASALPTWVVRCR